MQLSSEFDFDQQGIVNWGRNWLVNLNASKIQLVSFDDSNNFGTIDMKMVGLSLMRKSHIRCWDCISLVN